MAEDTDVKTEGPTTEVTTQPESNSADTPKPTDTPTVQLEAKSDPVEVPDPGKGKEYYVDSKLQVHSDRTTGLEADQGARETRGE